MFLHGKSRWLCGHTYTSLLSCPNCFPSALCRHHGNRIYPIATPVDRHHDGDVEKRGTDLCIYGAPCDYHTWHYFTALRSSLQQAVGEAACKTSSNGRRRWLKFVHQSSRCFEKKLRTVKQRTVNSNFLFKKRKFCNKSCKTEFSGLLNKASKTTYRKFQPSFRKTKILRQMCKIEFSSLLNW